MTFSNSGWRWWLADGRAALPARTIDHYFRTGDSSDITLLREKAVKSRRFYRIAPTTSPESPQYFAKQMALLPRKRLGALLGRSNPLVGYSHGTAELLYNLTLNEQTAHGVRTFTFGEYFRRGLPVQQVLLQEYLVDWQPFDAAWRLHENDAIRRGMLLLQLFDLLVSLRDAGITHLDLHPGNVMVSPGPQVPLRAIDCGQMSLLANPSLSAALHLGVFLHEFNGKRNSPSSQLEGSALKLLHGLVGAEADFAIAERLLPLLVRHSTKKPFSRRRLLRRAPEHLKLDAIEKQLHELPQRRRLSTLATRAPGVDSIQERQLTASIDEMMTKTR
ncbi:hypothetical protein ACUN9V_01435 [Salinicola sp. V024]|uniref:hypothetical protein n=1 Tax=Salinicola sp. V024 TaxID=3459609 RepID=UPI004044A102